eukprot:CAMPEP_0197034780 /NCGR_PEP_ID=MMETSP1384-20130603/12761_1 /TAXON_ID=29189 /ORGANISM="Ammonia sp." /LENGTH=127 /DNA_ID=CAMNT_0042464735 /DNA_START=154 /DNA_END=537 /DNA_ORIENTATION=+
MFLSNLQYLTADFFLWFLFAFQSSSDCNIKHLFQTLLSERRALEVLLGANLFGQGFAILDSQHLAHSRGDSRVIAQILFRANHNEGSGGAMMAYFRNPFRFHVLIRTATDNTIADEEDIGGWIRQRA